MKYKYIFVIAYSLLIAFAASAQDSWKITGSVITPANDPVAYATIRLFAKKKSPYLAATYTNTKGYFEILTKLSGVFWLQVNYTGYEDTLISVASGRDIALNNIVLKTSVRELQGVTVQGIKRLVTLRDDGISYNAENDPMADSDKALDLLRKTPMVSVDGDGKVTINGQSGLKVLVNGRKTALFARNASEALKNFPGSIIKRIDIITNPSAKYDAEGVGGVIDIITKKNVIGYNASLTLSGIFFDPFDWGTRNSRNIDGSLNLKKGTTGIVFGFNIDKTDNSLMRSQETIQPLITSSFTRRTGTGIIRGTNYSPECNVEFSYDIDSMNTFSLYGAYDRSKNISMADHDYIISGIPSTGTIASKMFSNHSERGLNWSTGLDYIRKFKSNAAKEFSIKFFGVFADSDNDAVSNQLNSAGDHRYVLNEDGSHDRQYTIQSDYVLPGKKNSLWEIGSKAILRRATSDYVSYHKSTPGDAYQVNTNNSDNFIYNQNVYSAYASYKFLLGKFNIRAGLRMEHTAIDGDFMASHTRVDQQYTRWLPNILVSRQLKNGHSLSAGYSQRLNRPYIYSLNPFVNNIDSFSVSTGNPFLNPQLSHVGNLQYRINKGKLFTTISMGYTYSNSYIIYGYSFNQTTGVTTTQPKNGGISNSVFLNLGINANLSQYFRFNINGNVSYLNITSPTLGGQQNKGFSGQAGFNGSYVAGKKTTITAFTNYYFPTLFLQGQLNGYYSYGFGGRYNLVKEKLMFILSLNNLFNKDGEFERIRNFADRNFSTEIRTFNLFRGVTLSLTWNFGKLSSNVSKKKGISNTDLL